MSKTQIGLSLVCLCLGLVAENAHSQGINTEFRFSQNGNVASSFTVEQGESIELFISHELTTFQGYRFAQRTGPGFDITVSRPTGATSPAQDVQYQVNVQNGVTTDSAGGSFTFTGSNVGIFRGVISGSAGLRDANFSFVGRFPVNQNTSNFIRVVNADPVVVASSGDQVARVGEQVLCFVNAVDPGGDELTIQWDLNSDGVYDDAEGALVAKSADFPGVYPVSARITDSNNGTTIHDEVLTVVPSVLATAVNGGFASRGQVSFLAVIFDSIIARTLSNEDVEILNLDTNQTVGEVSFLYDDSQGTTTAFLVFSGASTVQRQGDGVFGNSLVDGNYRLVIRGDAVTDPVFGVPIQGDYVFGGHTASDVPNDDFFRLEGDLDGDGAVGLSDFAIFRRTFGLSFPDPAFEVAADADGNMEIGLFDFARFRSVFGNSRQ